MTPRPSLSRKQRAEMRVILDATPDQWDLALRTARSLLKYPDSKNIVCAYGERVAGCPTFYAKRTRGGNIIVRDFT